MVTSATPSMSHSLRLNLMGNLPGGRFALSQAYPRSAVHCRSLQDPELDALPLEELAGARSLQIGQSRESAGLDAGLPQHGHRARGILHRPAGLGIQDVAQTLSPPHHEAPRVAAGRESAAMQLDLVERRLAGPAR